MEKQVIYYRIANLLFELVTPKGISSEELLPNFSLFVVQKKSAWDTVSRIELFFEESSIEINGAKLLSDVSLLWGDRFQFYELDQQYLTKVRAEKKGLCYYMLNAKDFSVAQIFIEKGVREFNMIISWFLMIVFAQVAVFHQSILIHASVVERKGEAYAFLGQSGTGKSTHSNLWINHLKDFALLNDDNPAIQIKTNGKVSVFGTPWSGKIACYRNEERLLKGFVRLKQSDSNRFYQKSNKEALVTVLPSCSGIRWNKDLFSSMVGVLAKIVKHVPIGHLSCLPNREAAVLCFNEINNTNKSI
ncbi:hypothetical protein [Mucilaginibacter lappiensis]|uniref:Phosphoenolpyruvate carboxykinase n=1 Tax=Mucilaginibacter lappiensis TaxID=354630 RepID=A0A841JSF8_9SPHI|nr:hypothetical protein [Mucilaginibacter lappiensis]MBB6130781.1 hypothetical protein [Mucilaginibacter lappiensis]